MKIIAVVLALAGAGLVSFAYLGDLTPRRSEARIPVDLGGS